MARRVLREERSKFQGAKQVLQGLNQTAHGVVHDLDVSLPSGAGGGYMMFWNSNTIIRNGDLSAPIFAPGAGTLSVCYASLSVPAIQPFEVDVYKNGSSIFTTPGTRPVVDTGFYVSDDSIPSITAVVARDAFEVEVIDNGTNPGRAIVVIVVV